MAANPSFLSEGNDVNITEQYKGMCIIFNSIVVPESSSQKICAHIAQLYFQETCIW